MKVKCPRCLRTFKSHNNRVLESTAPTYHIAGVQLVEGVRLVIELLEKIESGEETCATALEGVKSLLTLIEHPQSE